MPQLKYTVYPGGGSQDADPDDRIDDLKSTIDDLQDEVRRLEKSRWSGTGLEMKDLLLAGAAGVAAGVATGAAGATVIPSIANAVRGLNLGGFVTPLAGLAATAFVANSISDESSIQVADIARLGGLAFVLGDLPRSGSRT